MPEKEGLVGLGAAIEEVPRLGRDFIVERFHALDGKRTFVHGLASAVPEMMPRGSNSLRNSGLVGRSRSSRSSLAFR
jgi:hypothetical protein